MQLFNVVIVDDEPIILKGLVETFDWLGMGFNIIGSAKNGVDALKLVNENKPDVLITDILMKNMDGLELISRCQEQHPNMHFVVISAYREFDFAQKACSLGVFSYLLKPLDEQQIMEVMRDLHDVISQEYAGREQLSGYLKIFKEQQYAMETRDLKQFLIQHGEPGFLESRFHLIDSRISCNDYYTAVCLDINASDKILEQIDIDTQRFALSNVLMQKVGEKTNCWSFELPDGRLVLIVSASHESHSAPYLKSCLTYAESVLKLRITASIAAEYQGFSGLKQSYLQALKIFELGSETGANIIPLGIEAKAQQSPPPGPWYPSNHEYDIIHAIRLNDVDLSHEGFAAFTGNVDALNDKSLAQLCYHRLALSILFFLKETYGLTQQVEKLLLSYLRGIHTIKADEARDVLQQAVIRIINIRCEHSNSVFTSQADKYITDALSYIQRHLGIESLSISDLSKHLHLNAVYFGRLFKSRMGKSFKDYLQSKRIEQAMYLLDTTNKSIIEVAQDVGIQSPSYFALLFKQQTGTLPSEYKRKATV